LFLIIKCGSLEAIHLGIKMMFGTRLMVLIGRVQHKRVALFKLLNTNHPKHRLRTYL